MYLLLLVFGGLLGAAGVVLVGSGMSLREGTFDAAILTPGIVAAAGGLPSDRARSWIADAPTYRANTGGTTATRAGDDGRRESRRKR